MIYFAIQSELMSKIYIKVGFFLSTVFIFSLLSVGCDLHVDSVYLGRSESKLLGHVNSGNIAEVKKFLDGGGNVNLQDEPGMTPLHHAANADTDGSHFEMIKLLIDRGANVNALDDTDYTPLLLARNNDGSVAKLLIDAGADINATNRDGETLLYFTATGAAGGGHSRYLILTKFLLSNKAEVNIKLDSGDTLLHKVCHRYAEEKVSEVCELLIKNGADINAINDKGVTPLDLAIENDREITVKNLRKYGSKKSIEITEKIENN